MSEPLHHTSRVGHGVPAFIAVPVAVLALGFLIFLTAVAVLAPQSSVAGPGHPTKGPVPPAAFVANGIDAALVPDFVPVWGRDGTTVAGYIPKAYLLGSTLPTVTSSRPVADILPVYGDDLTTGSWVRAPRGLSELDPDDTRATGSSIHRRTLGCWNEGGDRGAPESVASARVANLLPAADRCRSHARLRRLLLAARGRPRGRWVTAPPHRSTPGKQSPKVRPEAR